MSNKAGPLAAIRVLDLTDERGIYGAKLLADLGADVVRPEAAEGDPLRQRGPHLEGGDQHESSLWHAFFASNRRFFCVSKDQAQAKEELAQLLAKAQIVLTCDDHFASGFIDVEAALVARDDLVVVNATSFGASGPWRDYLAPDLVAGALGGMVATTGDADTAPLKGFGDLNFMVSGAYVAIAALAALFSLRSGGTGQRAEVSVHESLVSCLEHVLMFYWYHEKLMRQDKVLPRRGAVHWSDAFAVMSAKNGSVMVTPSPSFDNQLAWLIEDDAHEDLIDPKYMAPENLRMRIERTMAVLGGWVSTKDAESLFYEAQSRHAPYGWVLPIERVADNPQLDARQWYVPYTVGETKTTGPGAPYHFSETPWEMAASEWVEADSNSLMAELGWEAKP